MIFKETGSGCAVVNVAGAYNCIKLVDTEDFAAKNGAILVTGGGLADIKKMGTIPDSTTK